MTFSSIYTQYYKRSFLFVRSYVHDDMVAEDITSEALIHLWEVMKSEEVSKPIVLLTVILKNKSLNYLKREVLKKQVESSVYDKSLRDLDYRINSLVSTDPNELFTEEITKLLKETLDRLPETTRKIFILSRFHHLTVNEIAVQMNLSPKSIEYHITKSLKMLRISLKDYLPIFYLLLYNKL